MLFQLDATPRRFSPTCWLWLLDYSCFHSQNWARWLALAWMAFHVAISAFHPVRERLVDAALFLVIAWILLRPAAGRYFRQAGAKPV